MFVNKYPIVGIVGDRGAGKTVTMTTLLDSYHKQGYTIFSNYELKGIPYHEISMSDLSEFPDWLHDGVIALDEAHTGADAYNFFNRQVQDLTLFITQTRKRRLIILYTTQVFTQVAKRLRRLTNYIIECEPTNINGVVMLIIIKRSGNEAQVIKQLPLDCRSSFDKYDTDEIILNKETKK